MIKLLLSLLLKIVRRLFWLSQWTFSLSLLLWYPLRWWPGDRLWPLQFLNYFMPWLLAGLIPALVVAGLARRKWLAAFLAVPTLLISFTYAPLFLPRPSYALADHSPLTVMSYNIWGHNRNMNAVVSLIQQKQPDLVLLQEAGPYQVIMLKKRLADIYPEGQAYFNYEPGMRQAIISRFPMTPLPGDYSQGRAQKAIVETPAGPVTVWNIHFVQPQDWSRHRRESLNLSKAVAAVETPLIVGGDFNTTDQAEAYQWINRHLANAHWEAGWGFGFSFPSPRRTRVKEIPIPMPMIRIDHIFYSPHFLARQAYTVSASGGSDHFPVIAELSLINHHEDQ
jgi:endonuclease/exonuclease/phosphatase (EEP) superfamily protein YafD